MAVESERVSGLARAFRRIAETRMTGLGLAHPGLAVAVVGFREWQGHEVGVLVTPWAMNLVVLAADAADGAALRLAADCRQAWRFPSGEYDLMGGEEPECGAFQFCPLFSPMHEFVDQAAAEDTAAAILDALFAPAEAETHEAPGAKLPSRRVPQGAVSRRGFLRALLG